MLTGLFKTKIFRRQLAALLGLSLVPLIVATWVTVSQGRAEIRRQTQAELEAAERGAEAQVREFLAFIRTRTADFAADVHLMNQVVTLAAEQSPQPWTTPRALELSQYLSQRKLPLLPEATEVFILDMHGTVVASSSRSHLGANHASSDYFLKGKEALFLSDIFREPLGEVTWVVAAPLQGVGEKPEGILVNRISPRVLSDITTGRRAMMLGASSQSMRIGETGETYIVNRDRLMITESRFLAGAPLKLRVDTLPVRKALEEGSNSWQGDYPDYRGVPISGVATLIQETNWVLLTEIDTSQAIAPVDRLRNTLLALALGLSLVVVVAASLLSRQLIRPIRRIVAADLALVEGKVAEGIIPENEIPNDEIGAIARARHRMLDELARGQADLRQADRLVAVGTLAAGMAHEVNHPLTFILANVDLAVNELRASGPDQPWVHDVLAMLGDARKGAERVQGVVQDLRSFTLGTEAELVPLSLHAAVDMALKLTAGEVHRRARVTKVLDPVPRVIANEGHLGQVLVNLVLNAAQAFTEAGDNEIVIHTRTAPDGKAVIEVSDNGPGIPPGVRARIFDPFFTTKPVGSGTGLGLFVCSRIVTSLGGTLAVESEFGKGATFRLTLPAAPDGTKSSEVDPSLGLPN